MLRWTVLMRRHSIIAGCILTFEHVQAACEAHFAHWLGMDEKCWVEMRREGGTPDNSTSRYP